MMQAMRSAALLLVLAWNISAEATPRPHLIFFLVCVYAFVPQ